MADDLEDELDEWGRSETPSVDGAFANRLETSLRREMLDRSSREEQGWLGAAFRPGVVVMAIAVLVFGLAFVSRGSDDGGLADGDAPVPNPTTIAVETTSSPSTDTPGSTEEPTSPSTSGDVQPNVTTDEMTTTVPPETTDDGSAPTVSDQTTIPRTTVPFTEPATTEPPTTVDATTIPPSSRIDVIARRNGRQVTASWTLDGDVGSIVGWVLIASIEGDGDMIAISRDAATRRLTGQLTDLEQTIRVEGRDRSGAVVISSEEIALSRDG